MATDILKNHPIFRKTPAAWHPYITLARLDRPIGTWLLLLPCWWALILASDGIFHVSPTGWLYALLFAIGALVMRAAGCVVNDIWDRDLDGAVERTRTRPLPAGDVTVRQALVFLAVLLAVGLAILLQFNLFSVCLGVASLALVVAYPLMKRWTWWPQLFLGFTFNWGALMGWSVLHGTLSAPAALLYVAGICWTLAYDTIYAHQDKEDDALAGIKSTARLFDTQSRKWVGGFFTLALLCFIAAKVAAEAGVTPSLFYFLPAALHIVWQMKTWRMNDPASSLRIFRANRDFAVLILIALAL